MKATAEQELFYSALTETNESLILNAVAGSGKTTTIMGGLERFQILPKTLLLAFNAKIKEELARRAPSEVTTLTLNGLGHRAWTKHLGKKVVLDSKKVGTIVSSLCKGVTKEETAELSALWPDIKDLVNKAKATGLLHKAFLSSGKGLLEDTDENWKTLARLHGIEFNPTILRLARKALETNIRLGLQGTIDFDDQLYLPTIFGSAFEKYDLVIIDEAQDLSEIQHHIISKCISKSGRIVIVGDPHQAIYGFRGAKADSMELLANAYLPRELTLSYTFRCSKAATAKAQGFVPHIKASEANLAGSIEYLDDKWEASDIAAGAVVLCRNIAPLVKLGLKCIRAGISCYIAGKDIGKPIIKACKQLPQGQNLHDCIIAWGRLERQGAKGNLETLNMINETVDTLLAVIEVSGCRTTGQLEETLKSLFSKQDGSITLSTIHRAKGLEWSHVYILDYWRIPQKWITRIIEDNPDASWMLEQENNLAYIAITRTKDKLTFINFPRKDDTYGH